MPPSYRPHDGANKNQPHVLNMKKTTSYILFTALLFISCTGHPDINPEYKLDTSKPISSRIVIFVSPTSDEIKKMKAETKDLEGFYAAADDYMFYKAEATNFLKSKKTPYKLTQEKKIKFIVRKKVIEMDYSKSERDWFVLIYNGKDKPTKTYAIDIDEHEALLKQLTEPTSIPTPLPH